jgi:cold shock CspA family protein
VRTRTGRRGTVVDFDEQVGLGRIRDEGGETYPFHCTQIADGSRSIPVGAEADFVVVAGHLGQWEAAALILIALR